MSRHEVVRVARDDEADVWYVQSSDVDGLVTEAGSFETLRERIKIIVANLLSDAPDRPSDIDIDIIAYAHDRITIAA